MSGCIHGGGAYDIEKGIGTQKENGAKAALQRLKVIFDRKVLFPPSLVPALFSLSYMFLTSFGRRALRYSVRQWPRFRAPVFEGRKVASPDTCFAAGAIPVGQIRQSAVTTATVARAAVEIARLTALEHMELCPEGVLALRTARE